MQDPFTHLAQVEAQLGVIPGIHHQRSGELGMAAHHQIAAFDAVISTRTTVLRHLSPKFRHLSTPKLLKLTTTATMTTQNLQTMKKKPKAVQIRSLLPSVLVPSLIRWKSLARR